MRKIKFRAWNKEDKKMLSWNDLQSSMSDGWHYDNNLNYFKFTEHKVMQHIDSKDRNKKEIYEEDILKTNVTGWIGKVVFRNARFCLEDNLGGFSDSLEWDKCEVISNMFENPELLKGVKI